MKLLLLLALSLSLLSLSQCSNQSDDVEVVTAWMQGMEKDALDKTLQARHQILAECQQIVQRTINQTRLSLSSVVITTTNELNETIRDLQRAVTTLEKQSSTFGNMALEAEKLREAAAGAREEVAKETNELKNKIKDVSARLDRHMADIDARNEQDMDVLIDKATNLPTNLNVVSNHEGVRGVLFKYLLQYQEKIDAWKMLIYGILAFLLVSLAVVYAKFLYFQKQTTGGEGGRGGVVHNHID